MHREMFVAMKAGCFARPEELGRDADAPFRRGSNLFELTWQASERERRGKSDSDKEMSHPRPEANRELRFQQSSNKRELMLYVNHV